MAKRYHTAMYLYSFPLCGAKNSKKHVLFEKPCKFDENDAKRAKTIKFIAFFLSRICFSKPFLIEKEETQNHNFAV